MTVSSPLGLLYQTKPLICLTQYPTPTRQNSMRGSSKARKAPDQGLVLCTRWRAPSFIWVYQYLDMLVLVCQELFEAFSHSIFQLYSCRDHRFRLLYSTWVG